MSISVFVDSPEKDLCAKISDFAENVFSIFKLGERSRTKSDFLIVFSQPRRFEMSLSSSADISLASDLVESACLRTRISEIEKIEEKKGFKSLLLIFSDTVPKRVNPLDYDFIIPVSLTENAKLEELDRLKGRLD
ncbi:unnamed protein product [Oikopleura dioica]|uniref:Uncharacterized protein n=1 Tax=Oikopleura dioica TaxID=34765 RepID=E4XES7_OIKDI|nr:unnamed protein product [Oikopleura dioica]